MGQRPWMGRLESPVHQGLQIGQQGIDCGGLRSRCSLWLGPHRRQRLAGRGITDPIAEQVRRAMQKRLQIRIGRMGRREGNQVRQQTVSGRIRLQQC